MYTGLLHVLSGFKQLAPGHQQMLQDPGKTEFLQGI